MMIIMVVVLVVDGDNGEDSDGDDQNISPRFLLNCLPSWRSFL